MLVLGQEDPLSRGAVIAIAGLLIVFAALLLISLFIAVLPKLLEQVARVWPEVESHHGSEARAAEPDVEQAAVLAAIGFVLHTELQKQLAAERAARR